MMRSKRGSTMVEAAVVFPMVILALVSVVYIMISMFEVTQQVSMLHTKVREEAGYTTETYSFSPVSSKEFNVQNGLLTVKGETTVKNEKGALLKSGSMRINTSAYKIREEDFIRKADYASFE